MELEFWEERWRLGETAFHLDRPNPLLKKYWSSVGLNGQGTVLVPLCGKSHDLVWLRDHGHDVVGVELSEVATAGFFDEQGLAYERTFTSHGAVWETDGIRIFQQDFFATSRSLIGEISAVFDRAALIALPEKMRKAYVTQLDDVTGLDRHTLLITLQYDQSIMNGPPFSVKEDEVRRLFSAHFNVDTLSSENIIDKLPRFREKGLQSLVEPTFLMTPL